MSARADFVSAIIMAAIAVFFLLTANSIDYDPYEPGIGPRAFPITVSILICLLSLGLMIRAFRPIREAGWKLVNHDELHLFVTWVLPMVAVAFAYVLLIDMFQYLLPTIVACSATLALFGNRGKVWLVVIPVLVGLLYYILFFGLFRLLESPGSVIEYENIGYFAPLRSFFGL